MIAGKMNVGNVSAGDAHEKAAPGRGRLFAIDPISSTCHLPR
jgi:hypothetical protein